VKIHDVGLAEILSALSAFSSFFNGFLCVFSNGCCEFGRQKHAVRLLIVWVDSLVDDITYCVLRRTLQSYTHAVTGGIVICCYCHQR